MSKRSNTSIIFFFICVIIVLFIPTVSATIAVPVNIGITPISGSWQVLSWEGPSLDSFTSYVPFPHLAGCSGMGYGVPTGTCTLGSFTFTATPESSPPWDYFVTFGDGTYLDCPYLSSDPNCHAANLYSGTDIDHFYTQAGTFPVTLFYQGSLGGSYDIRQTSVTILPAEAPQIPVTPTPSPVPTPNYPAPVASFTSNQQQENSPETVQFSDTSSGQIVGWKWNFEDGTPLSTERNPTHTFVVQPGQSYTSYTVYLTVTDSFGRESTTTQNIGVYESLNPNFQVTPTSGLSPLTVTFTDLTPAVPSDIQSYTWNFGDGTPPVSYISGSITTTFTHTYNANGIGYYEPTLTIVPKGGGEIFSKSQWIAVGPLASNINTDFTATPQSGNSPLTVQFTDKSTIIQSGISDSIRSWSWDFGDNDTSNNTLQNPVHVYHHAGVYTVKLTVSDTLGFFSTTQTKTNFIDVIEPGLYVLSNGETNLNAPASMDHPYTLSIQIYNSGDKDVPFNLLDTETPQQYYSDDHQISVAPVHNPTFIPAGQSATYFFTYDHHWDWLNYFENKYVSYIDKGEPYLALLADAADLEGKIPTSVSKDITIPLDSLSDVIQVGDEVVPAFMADTQHTYVYTFTGPQSVNSLSSLVLPVGPNQDKVNDIVSAWDEGGLAGASGSLAILAAPESGGTSLALCGVSAILTTQANNDMQSAIDPDMNYKQVVLKEHITVPEIEEISDPLGKQAALDSLRLLEDKKAYSQTMSKFDGAQMANDPEWSLIQKNMASIYAKDVALDSTNMSISMSNFINELQNENIVVNDTSIQQTQSIMSQQGFPVQENRMLKELGWKEDQLTQLSNLTAATLSPEYIENYSTSFNDTIYGLNNLYKNESTLSASYVANSSIYAHVRFDPGVVDLADSSQWVNAYVEIPNQNVSEINLSTVKMNGIPAMNDTSYSFVSNPTITTDASTGYQEMEIAFAKPAVIQELSQGENEVTLSGTINGIFFVGTGPLEVYTTSKPVAAFTANTTSGDSPLMVAFSDESAGYPTSWIWDFGDGTQSFEQNPTHTYTSAGSENITLIARNDNGLSTVRQINFITVTSSLVPAAAFTASTNSATAPYLVTFSDQSSNSPTGWFWEFGDGSNSTDQNPVYTYASGGNYTVSLTAENIYGSNTIFQTLTLPGSSSPSLASNIPITYFTATANSGTAPYSVTFTDLSDNSPTNWYWDFGDGSYSTEQNPVHIYTIDGNYPVKLIAGNSYGYNSSFQIETLPGIVSVLPPVANFTANITTGIAPLTVQFTDNSTNSPTSWNWSFGDGSFSSLQDIMHTYTTAGSYTVNLTVVNAAGNSTATQQITVSPAILMSVSSFVANVTSGTAPLAVQFTDTSTNTPIRWNWSFGDGTFSDLQNVTHTYASAGNYSVALTVTNTGGSNTTALTDYILAQPAVRPYSFQTTNNALQITIDGIPNNSPETVNWIDGMVHNVSVPQNLNLPNQSQYTFTSWSGMNSSTSPILSITAGQNTAGSYIANYSVQYNTTTTLVSTTGSSVIGQPVTFTATVTGTGSTTPSGTVTFIAGTTNLGTGPLNANGQAVFTATALPLGSHSITAIYRGDSTFFMSSSPAVTELVGPASTRTSIVSSANPSVYGQPVTLSASVSVTPPGSGTPAGTVTFNEGPTVVATGTLFNGIVTNTTSSLSAGNHSITAIYSGDLNFTANTSAIFTQNVNKASTSTTVNTDPNPSISGQAETLTATITVSSPGSGSPTGTVAFMDSTVSLGTASVNAGHATMNSSSLSAGQHLINAVYRGDNNFQTSTGSVNLSVLVPVKVIVVPTTINTAGNGYFLAFVILPNGYPAKEVNTTPIQCNGANAKRVLTSIFFPQVFGAIFKTSDLVGTTPGDKVPLALTGVMKSNVGFEGSATVKVIQKNGTLTNEIQDYIAPKDAELFTNYFNGG